MSKTPITDKLDEVHAELVVFRLRMSHQSFTQKEQMVYLDKVTAKLREAIELLNEG